MISIREVTQKLSIQAPEETIIKRTMIGYTEAGVTAYKVWNAFKAIFFVSDWQLSKRILKDSIQKHENMYYSPEALSQQTNILINHLFRKNTGYRPDALFTDKDLDFTWQKFMLNVGKDMKPQYMNEQGY